MSTEPAIALAKSAVIDWYKTTLGKYVTGNMVYVVWYCKTLQNNKVLLSTNIPDKRYFEFTYNGDSSEGYLDVYVKEDSRTVRKEDVV